MVGEQLGGKNARVFCEVAKQDPRQEHVLSVDFLGRDSSIVVPQEVKELRHLLGGLNVCRILALGLSLLQASPRKEEVKLLVQFGQRHVKGVLGLRVNGKKLGIIDCNNETGLVSFDHVSMLHLVDDGQELVAFRGLEEDLLLPENFVCLLGQVVATFANDLQAGDRRFWFSVAIQQIEQKFSLIDIAGKGFYFFFYLGNVHWYIFVT